MRLHRLSLVAALLCLAQAAPVAAQTWPGQAWRTRNLAQAARLLAEDERAESTFRACLAAYLRQGLPPARAADACAVQLIEDQARGFGGDPVARGGGADAFDPAKVQSACGGPDPMRAQQPNPVQHGSWLYVDPKSALRLPNGRYVLDDDGAPVSEWGGYSFGGNPDQRFDRYGNPIVAGTPNEKAEPYNYHGMSEDEVIAEKMKLIEAAKKAEAEWRAAEKAAAADPGNADKRRKADEAKKKSDEAGEKATGDPNFGPRPVVRGADGAVCQSVLAQARETLRECTRNGWKRADCRQLHARMNQCPDPTLILVDPDAGYVCAPEVDAKAVAAAAQARCEQVTTPGPGGGTPCAPPDVRLGGGVLRGPANVCSDPRAYVDGGSDACILTLPVIDAARPDIRAIIQLGLERLSGPIFVLPTRDPLPRGPQPDPMPGPRH